MRVLITGISGFMGPYLAEECYQANAEVWGLVRWRSDRSRIPSYVRLIEADVTDAHAMKEAVERVNPGRVFHLAAQSYVPYSWNNPTETLATNIHGTLNLLEACRSLFPPRILIAGSSEEYGLVEKSESPVDEDQPLRPLSPYAVSKVAQDLLGYQYAASYGLRIVRTRAFNHAGPGQSAKFLISDFCCQKILIEKDEQEALRHGDLESVRDFTDVRDMARAYWLALERCEPGVYNVGSGVEVTARQVAEMLDVSLQEDASRRRPSDVPRLVANPARFHSQTGWNPRIPLMRTIMDTLDWWREHL